MRPAKATRIVNTTTNSSRVKPRRTRLPRGSLGNTQGCRAAATLDRWAPDDAAPTGFRGDETPLGYQRGVSFQGSPPTRFSRADGCSAEVRIQGPAFVRTTTNSASLITAIFRASASAADWAWGCARGPPAPWPFSWPPFSAKPTVPTIATSGTVPPSCRCGYFSLAPTLLGRHPVDRPFS